MGEVNTGGGGGKHKGGKPKAKKSSTRIDMTPMVDLAFLLLTFFMLTTSFSKPKSMEIVMPDKPKADDPKPPKINDKDVMNLIMAGNNKLYYYIGIENPQVEQAAYSATNEKSIRKILLSEKQKNIQRNGKDKFMVLIKATKEAKYKNVVDIFDEMNVTAIQRYALVDITPSEVELVENVTK
jgi:biopolymer transport protein ExbD